jgi:hypothetical protein
VGHVGDAEIENYELENAVLELAGGMRNSNRRLMSVQVNDVNLSFRFNVGEFRGAENNRFDVPTTYLSPRFAVCPDEDQQNCEALQFDFALEGIRDNTTEANNFKDWLVQAIGNSILVQNNTIEVFAPKTDDQTDPPKLTAGEKFAAATGSIVGFFAILLGYFKLFDPLMGLYLFGIVKQMYHVYWKKDTLTTVTNHSDVTMELIICEDTQDFTNARTSSLSFTFLSKILPNDIGVSQVFGTEETYTTGRRLQHFSIPKGQQKVFYVRTDYHTALARYTGKEKYAGKFSDEYPGERRGYMIYELSMRTTEGSEFSIEAGIPKQDEIEFVPIARWEDWKEKFRGDDESVSKRGAENEDEGELDPQFFINSTIRDDVQWYFKFLEGVYRAYVFWRAGYCNAIENKSDKALDLIIRENKTQVTTFDRSSFSYGFPEFIFGEGGTEVEFGHQQTFTTGRKVQWMHLLPGQTKRISIRADYEIATATYKKPEEGSIFEKGYNVHEIKQLPWTQKKYVIGPESASGKVYFVKLGQWREFVRTMTKSSGPENQPWMPDEDRDVRLRRSLAPPVRPPVLKNYDRSVSLPFLREETAVGAGNAAWVPLPLLRPADTPAEGPWNAI